MTSKIEEVINLVQSLSLAEQLELLKALSATIQQTHAQENQIDSESEINFSVDSFRTSWEEAVTGQTLPLCQL